MNARGVPETKSNVTLRRLQVIASLALLSPGKHNWELLSSDSDWAFRNRLQVRWLAKQCADWIAKKVEVKQASGSISQLVIVVRADDGLPTCSRVLLNKVKSCFGPTCLHFVVAAVLNYSIPVYLLSVSSAFWPRLRFMPLLP